MYLLPFVVETITLIHTNQSLGTQTELPLGTLRIRTIKGKEQQSLRIATLILSAEIMRSFDRVPAASAEHVLLLNQVVGKLVAELLAHKTELNHAIVSEVIHSHSARRERVRTANDIFNHYVLVLAVKKLLEQPTEDAPITLHNQYYKPELE